MRIIVGIHFFTYACTCSPTCTWRPATQPELARKTCNSAPNTSSLNCTCTYHLHFHLLLTLHLHLSVILQNHIKIHQFSHYLHIPYTFSRISTSTSTSTCSLVRASTCTSPRSSSPTTSTFSSAGMTRNYSSWTSLEKLRSAMMESNRVCNLRRVEYCDMLRCLFNHAKWGKKEKNVWNIMDISLVYCLFVVVAVAY